MRIPGELFKSIAANVKSEQYNGPAVGVCSVVLNTEACVYVYVCGNLLPHYMAGRLGPGMCTQF